METEAEGENDSYTRELLTFVNLAVGLGEAEAAVKAGVTAAAI